MDTPRTPSRSGPSSSSSDSASATPVDFIREIVARDLASGRHTEVVTRFPPEPNGYLHIGHSKSICLNFGVAQENGGRCHLRFDDTNPVAEDPEYVEAIKRDVHWLGFDWGEHEYHASDYYDRLYEYAQQLVRDGKAYVCSLSEEDIRAYRGTVKEPGRPSPDRDRPPEESLELLERMRRGEFEEGAYTLRAKIDMAASNMKMRDPLIYRIRHAHHHRTGDAWKIYPFYDFAHCLSDAEEHITHSLCTLEFTDNRELYDWFIEQLPTPSRPRQIEFARLNLTYTVMSKRKLLRLVEGGHVSGWDDPRMCTLSGLRRRGYTPEAIRAFSKHISVAKTESTIEFALLEHFLREDLNRRAPRVMAVLRPLKVVLDNYPEGQTEQVEAVNNPEDASAGSRMLPFSRELYIESDDFREDPPRKFFRLAPGQEVRLKHAYFIRCERVVKDDRGRIVELRCTYDPQTRGGSAPDGRKVKGTLHWVSAVHAVEAEVRLYDHLFTVPYPGDEEDFTRVINRHSLQVLSGCKLEPGLATADTEAPLQFLRHGYFCLDSRDSRAGALVFNRTVPLRDSWAKIEKASGQPSSAR